MAVVSTLDPKQGILHIQVAPGCEDILDDLISHLSENEKIPIRKMDGPVCTGDEIKHPVQRSFD
jgi:hypothetical protein